MNLKERVIAQIQHQETDWVPYTLAFEGDVAERLDVHFGGPAWRAILDSAIVRFPMSHMDSPAGGALLARDYYGSVWRTDRRPFHLEQPALEQPTLHGFSFPTLETLFSPGWDVVMRRAMEDKGDHFLVAGLGFGLHDRAWALRGFESMMMDAAADPDFFAELVNAVADHQRAILDRLLTLPVDGIMFADDWGYQQGVMLGPERWRRFIKEPYARLYDRVHRAGKYALSHCCGSVAAIMDDIVEMELDVLQSVQPEPAGMNPYELKQRYGARIAFWGGLGSQSTIPFGAPNTIRAEVQRLCREMGRGGGYILAPAKDLQPETPTANAAAVVEAFLEQAGVAIAV